MRCAGSMLDFLGADSEIGTESSLVVSQYQDSFLPRNWHESVSRLEVQNFITPESLPMVR